MALELKLRNSLSDIKKSRLEEIQNKIKPLLNRTTNVNIDFTEHDVNHALRVEAFYSICIPNIEEILTEDEKYLLIISTLIHDIGMVGRSKHRLEENYDTEIRNSHNYRSGDFIIDYHRELGVMDREARVIRKIAEGHRLVDLSSITNLQPFGMGNNIRIRLLAALLRLCDELDLLEERAPQLVQEYLNVNPESAKHFVLHRTFDGVVLEGENIKIVSHVPNKKLEEEVKKLYEGINDKFQQVKPILQENNINVNSIEMSMDTKDVVKQDILLFMTKVENVIEEEIVSNFEQERPPHEIEEALRELYSKGYIERDGEYLRMSLKERHFNYLKDIFISTESELEFAKSKYLSDYIEKCFDDYVKEKFGVYYDRGQREDRINILTHMPTSIKYFFDGGNTPYDIGSIDRRVTLELGLLHALSIDSLKYPEELSQEILLSAQSIENDVSNKLHSFLKLISAIPEAEKKKQLISNSSNLLGENIETHSDLKDAFKIVNKHSKNQLKNLLQRIE